MPAGHRTSPQSSCAARPGSFQQAGRCRSRIADHLYASRSVKFPAAEQSFSHAAKISSEGFSAAYRQLVYPVHLESVCHVPGRSRNQVCYIEVRGKIHVTKRTPSRRHSCPAQVDLSKGAGEARPAVNRTACTRCCLSTQRRRADPGLSGRSLQEGLHAGIRTPRRIRMQVGSISQWKRIVCCELIRKRCAGEVCGSVSGLIQSLRGCRSTEVCQRDRQRTRPGPGTEITESVSSIRCDIRLQVCLRKLEFIQRPVLIEILFDRIEVVVAPTLQIASTYVA